MSGTQRGYVGRSVLSRSAPRLVQGSGVYIEDVAVGNVLEAVFVRSPHAYAHVLRVVTDAARAMPGVEAVLVGQTLEQAAPLPVHRFIEDMRVPVYHALDERTVRYVGEPVAVVIAVTRAQAEDAASLVHVEYQPLQAITLIEAALGPGAPVLHAELGDNVCYRTLVRGGDVEAGFARATHVVRVEVVHHRLSAAALEPRGTIASYVSGDLCVWSSTQTPHQLRDDLAAALGLAQHRVRVIVPDVGGGFGSKGTTYREDVAVAALARQLRRSVRWIASRSEEFQSTQQARDQIDSAELALDADGHMLALRTRTICNLGAYMLGRSARQALRVTQYSTGAYRIPCHAAEAVTVFTNTVPTGAYRGAGRPEAAYLIERVVDAAARELSLDPAELRRRNFLQPADFPYRTPNGATFDSGDYSSLLDKLLDAAGYQTLLAEQVERRGRGELVGVGIATFVENTAAGWESGALRVEADGSVTAISGAIAMGQGVETVLAQIVADELGTSLDQITVRMGDTALTQQAQGSFGSRSTAIAGSALRAAAHRVRSQAAAIAAELLEVAPADIAFDDGAAYVLGAPGRRVGWPAIARAAYPSLGQPRVREPGLEEHAFFHAPAEAISAGAYLALVSVDHETGRIRVERMVAADDCGTVVNPLLTAGQVQGAIAQGIGEALFERVVYDGAGQLLSTSLLDYPLPRVTDVVDARMVHQVTRSPHNPLGAKGAGEAGILGTPPAIVNAVIDALAPLGIGHLDPPLHPEKIWRLVRQYRERHDLHVTPV